MTTRRNTIELASFDVNAQGRILDANHRFCRIFGFDDAEVRWHYITDLCRRASDWIAFRDNKDEGLISARMKNRKGRSFCCKLNREVSQGSNGELVYHMTICRNREQQSASLNEPSKTFIFLARCACCGEQIQVATAGELRMRQLCNNCAKKMYPEAYETSCLEQAQV